MKKLLMCSVILLCGVSVKAQTTQGWMMIGGGITYTSTSFEASSDLKESSLSFSPSFGFFVADNLAVGASLQLSKQTDDNGLSKTVNSSTGIGPFIRYYKFTSAENFAFYGQASFLIQMDKEDDTPGGETNGGGFLFQISPGFSYFFNEHWALDLSVFGLGVSSYDPDKDIDNNKTTTVIFSVESLQPTIGVRYHFGGN